jgi:hypothetical protein
MMSAVRVFTLVVVVLAILLLWRTWRGAPRPEPVRFAPVPEEQFDDGGTLTDAWADFDGDGDPDRFVGFNGGRSRLYRNEGNGRFVDVADSLGVRVDRSVRTSAWGDFDADGDPDLLLGYAGGEPVTALWRNDGPDGFVEAADAVGVLLRSGVTRQATWVDYDGDGDLDLFLAMRDGPNRLFRNDGEGFSDVTAASAIGDPRRSVGALWLDIDEDGDLDAYVANMNGDANGLWINEEGRFADQAAAWGLADGGRALGDEDQGTVRPCAVDYDHDGDLDLFTANYGPNGLFRNPGGPGPWRNVAGEVGLAVDGRYDTCAWADFDHDGRVDLYVNGTVTGGQSHRDWLLRRRDGPFEDVTPPELLVEADHGATWVDHDLDGDVDLALTGVQETGVHHLVQNLLRPELAFHSVKVRLLDGDGRATRVGNEVRVFAAGTFDVLGTALVDSGSGYDGQNDLPVHFGLPGGHPVDLEITTIVHGRRIQERLPGVDPRAYRGRVVTVRMDELGQLVR